MWKIKVLALIALLVLVVSYAPHPGRKVANIKVVKTIEGLVPDCSNYKKLSRKKVFALLKEKKSKDYDDYMACKHLKRHSNRDHFGKCEKISESHYLVHGKVSYGSKISPYLGPYRYDVIKNQDETIIQVRVHFETDILDKAIAKEHIPTEHYRRGGAKVANYGELIDVYLKNASWLWTEYSPMRDVSFEFIRVMNKKESHFSLKLKNKVNSGTLYHKYWSLDSKEHTGRPLNQVLHRVYSHEIGHMMGLEDEINMARANLYPGYFVWFDKKNFQMDCSRKSLMCLSITRLNGDIIPLPFHYYLILKRLAKCDGLQ